VFSDKEYLIENERCWEGEYAVSPIVNVSDVYGICKDFSENSTNNYSNRGQDDPENIKRQILFGKLGEFVAYRTIKQYAKGLSEPDVEIKEVSKKNYDCDMISDDYKFAVKSCSRNSGLPFSWVFQKLDVNGYGRDKFIFKNSFKANEFVLMVVVDEKDHIGRVVASPSLYSLHMFGLFERTLSRKIRDYKMAIYWSSLVGKKLVPTLSKRTFLRG